MLEQEAPDGAHQSQTQLLKFFARIRFAEDKDKMSDSAIKALDLFTNEVLSDNNLRSQFVALESRFKGGGGPYSEWTKVKQIRTRVQTFVIGRDPSQSTIEVRQRLYAFCFQALDVGLSRGCFETEMSRDYVSGNSKRGIVSIYDVLCWRSQIIDGLIGHFAGEAANDLRARIHMPATTVRAFEADISWYRC